MLKSWEEMSLKEQLECMVWDAYKDAYGVRPRFMNLEAMTVEELKFELESCSKVAEQNYIREQEEQKIAIAKFEDRIDNLMHDGTSRSRVVAWFMQAEEVNSDFEYFEYLNGLPYGYLKQMEYV